MVDSGKIDVVGVTGLEPATSRPPAVRATNCATPRYQQLYQTTYLVYTHGGRSVLTVTSRDPFATLEYGVNSSSISGQ